MQTHIGMRARLAVILVLNAMQTGRGDGFNRVSATAYPPTTLPTPVQALRVEVVVLGDAIVDNAMVWRALPTTANSDADGLSDRFEDLAGSGILNLFGPYLQGANISSRPDYQIAGQRFQQNDVMHILA